MSHRSPLSIDYDQLESLLSAGQWKEADQESNRLIEKIETVESRKREQDSKFRASEDIKIIDRLWTQASRGHFGFSTQAEIYRSSGGNDSLGKTQKQVWKDFCQQVGWNARPRPANSNSMWPTMADKLHRETTFNFSNQAPKGHLPSFAGKNTGLEQFDLSLKNFTESFLNKARWNWGDILERLQLL